jgi:tricorn protease
MKHSIAFLVLLSTFLSFSQGTQLLRQPTMHDNEVVFVYANDLWKVSATGGTAIRLTSDEGYESSPHFSNDGKYIAFTAQYDGNVDVFVIPSSGGEPKRGHLGPISGHSDYQA